MFKKYRHKDSREIVEAFPEELVIRGGSKAYIYWHIKDSPTLIPDKQFLEQYDKQDHFVDVNKKLSKQTITLNRELSKEVLEAMEDLRNAINYPLKDDSINTAQEEISYKAENLLNALDSQFNHKVRDKEDSLSDGESKSFIGTDWGKEDGNYTVETKYKKEGDKLVIEEINEIKPKESIWKPVSELPTDGIYSILAKQKDNYYFGELNGHMDYYPQISLFFDGGLGESEEKGTIDKCCTLTDFINQHNSLLDRVERLEKIIGDKII